MAHSNQSPLLKTSWEQVAAAVSAIDASIGKWLAAQYSIGLTEYRALEHIGASPTHELRITELAQKLGLNQSSVTRLVGRMEDKNLAFRDTCPDDARGIFAVITDHGLETVARIQTAYEAKIQEILKDATQQFPHLEGPSLSSAFQKVGRLIA